MSKDAEQNPLIGSKRAWFIWSLCALTFGYAFFHRVTPSVMVNDLMSEFAIGAALLGTLSSLYFYPYVALQVFLGALIDRLGPRLLLTGALIIAGVGSFLFGTADSLTLAYIGRLLIGIGASVGFLATLAIAAKWFPAERFAFLAGLVMFFGMVSGIFASGPLALFVENFGWRTSMMSLGGLSLLLALLIFLFVRNSPNTEGGAQEKPVETWSAMWRGLAKAAGTLEVWKIAIVASTMSGPMLALGTLWGTPFLKQAYALERPTAAFLASFMLFGWAIGAPLFGWLSDRIKRRKVLLNINAGILVLAMVILVFIPNIPLVITTLIFAIIGASGSAMSITFALGRENTSSQITGSVLGIINSMTVASGALLQPVVGLLLDQVWDGTIIDGNRVYESSDYRIAFGAVLFTSVVGFLVSLTLKKSPIER